MAGAQGFEPHLPDSEFVATPYFTVSWCLFPFPIGRIWLSNISQCRMLFVRVVVVRGRGESVRIFIC